MDDKKEVDKMNLKEINRLLKIIKDRINEPDKLLLYIEKLEKELKDDWIKIDMDNQETLPPDCKVIDCYSPIIGKIEGRYYGLENKWGMIVKNLYEYYMRPITGITHWKPLPEPPDAP